MDDAFAMDVLETMARMLEVLVARIEVLENKINDQCSCKRWASDLRPGTVIPSLGDMDLTQNQVDDLLNMKPSEIMPQG